MIKKTLTLQVNKVHISVQRARKGAKNLPKGLPMSNEMLYLFFAWLFWHLQIRAAQARAHHAELQEASQTNKLSPTLN